MTVFTPDVASLFQISPSFRRRRLQGLPVEHYQTHNQLLATAIKGRYELQASPLLPSFLSFPAKAEGRARLGRCYPRYLRTTWILGSRYVNWLRKAHRPAWVNAPKVCLGDMDPSSEQALQHAENTSIDCTVATKIHQQILACTESQSAVGSSN